MKALGLACLLGAVACRAVGSAEAEGPAGSWPLIQATDGFLGAGADESCRRDAPPLTQSKSPTRLRVAPHEVRQAEFQALMGFNPSFHPDCPDCPVESVTMDEAALYCARLGEKAGLPSCYECEAAGGQDGLTCTLTLDPDECTSPRLPTATEFEHFARAGARTGTAAGSVSNCMGEDPVAETIAWYKANSDGLSHRVGTKAPTSTGLFDVTGNVAEWVHPKALKSHTRPEFGTLVGGSWFHNAHHLLAFARLRAPMNRRLAYAGFRCVQTQGPSSPSSGASLPKVRAKRGKTPKPSGERKPVKVAAILAPHLASPEIAKLCGDNENCRIEALVREAGDNGARLIVAPEYGLAQYDLEPVPALNSRPSKSPKASPLLSRFAKVADETDAYVVVNLQTQDSDGARYNTVVALDPQGRVVGRHHKFELFGGEREDLTPGEAVGAFETPFGRVGLLVCADIYGQPALHHELMRELDARIVAWSASWTVEGATQWQSAFARDWNVFFVAANGARGEGAGGGVFDPNGQALTEANQQAIAYGLLPM